jgi:hypothetical protein
MSEAEDNEDYGEGEELSFTELLASVMLNEEIIITIPKDEVVRVKNGLKNTKTKQATRFKEDGLAVDPSTLVFVERPPSNNDDEFIDLSIQLVRRGTIKVAKIVVPNQDFNDF